MVERVGRVFAGQGKAEAVTALEPISLVVADNDFLGILGPSGCGKSTLLRIVAGLDRPSSGRVLLDGRTVDAPGAERGMVFQSYTLFPGDGQAGKERVGMVFQSYTLFPWLTVAGNVAFGLRERGVPAVERQRMAEEFVAEVGLSGFAGHYPKQLSGGMQQRTALARALANDPRILLLDEPFGALDHQTRALMQELLLGIWEARRKTVLFVTHDVEEAIFMANRVVVFTARPGRIKCELPVPLPHPRHYRMKSALEFVRLKEQLTEEIRVEALAAAGLAAG